MFREKIKFILPGGLIVGLVIFNTIYYRYPTISYDLLDVNGRVTSYSKNVKTYNDLIKKGSILYIEFSEIGNNFYHNVDISFFSLKRCETLSIHSMEFEFENQKQTINLNEIIGMKQFGDFFREDIFVVEDNVELMVKGFFCYIPHLDNNIKIYMQKIFKKTAEDIGISEYLTLRVHYSLDNRPAIIQEIQYRVDVFKGRHVTPNWMYRLFPGM